MRPATQETRTDNTGTLNSVQALGIGVSSELAQKFQVLGIFHFMVHKLYRYALYVPHILFITLVYLQAIHYDEA